jgi:hypothetical protein
MKTSRLVVLVEPAMMDFLKARSRAEGESVAVFVRRAILAAHNKETAFERLETLRTKWRKDA